ncbi:WD40 repeat domain-containing protein [Kutzneria sp. NPDC051319]|uniref:WD40 repeat domain-containing protein n=1 Tax=Kutzneria sp. NPDC051319 TaxID=3155047 RepID=UPI00341EE56F
MALIRIGTAPAPRLTETFTLPLPDGGLHSVVVLPDGDTCVVSAENDGTLYLVSLAEGRAFDRLVGHVGPVNSLALADAGRLLLSASDDEFIRVWDTRTWQTVAVLAGHSGHIRSVAAQGMVAVSGGEDRTVRVWDLGSATCMAVLDDHVSSVDHVAVSPDGAIAASAGRDNQVLLWDLDGLRLSRELYGTPQFIREMPNMGRMGDTWILCGRNDTGRGHEEAPTALLFGDSCLYTAAGEVICWDLADDSEVARFPRQGFINTLGVYGEFVAAGSLHGIRVCGKDGVLATFGVETGRVVDLAYLPDGRLVTAHERGSLKLWPALRGDEQDGGRHHSNVTDIVTSGDGSLAASLSLTGEVLLWDVASGAVIAVVDSSDVPCEPVFLPDGTLVVAERAKLHLVSRDGSQRILLPAGGEANIVSVAVVDDRSLLVVPYSAPPQLWSLDGPQRAFVGASGNGVRFPSLIVDGLALVPSALPSEHPLIGGLSVNVTGVPALQCWDLASGELRWTRHGRITTELVWATYCWTVRLADGAVATPGELGDETSLMLLDAATGDTHQEFLLPKGYSHPCVELVDGALLFVDHDELVSTVWGIDPDEDVLRPRLQFPRSRALCLVPDRNLVVRLGEQHLYAHRLSSGRAVCEVRLPADAACLAMAGDVAVVGDRDGGVHFFRVELD